MGELAYLNGVFGPISEAKVSIEDRGFQFGDGIYEVVVAYNGRLFQMAPHMQRFRRSAAAIGLEYDFDANPLEPIIEEGLKRSGFSDAMVYLQITRGVAPRIHAIPESITPTVVMTFKALPTVSEERRARGAKVMTTPDQRWPNCYIKAIILLPNILAQTEAQRRGCEEAIFLSDEGQVRECTSSNVFIVSAGRLKTPPRTESVLHGVTRAFILECAAGIELPVDEEHFHVDALMVADEVFISSTGVEVLGVTSIDDQPVGNGQVGPVTRRLYEEFCRRARC